LLHIYVFQHIPKSLLTTRKETSEYFKKGEPEARDGKSVSNGNLAT
jgi:hypothetical protein